jgi:hypothetical protein
VTFVFLYIRADYIGRRFSQDSDYARPGTHDSTAWVASLIGGLLIKKGD